MKWLKNLESLAVNNELGKCPICQSKNMDCGFTVVVAESDMGYGAIWCNDCHSGYHISRCKIENSMKIQNVPTNINFRN